MSTEAKIVTFAGKDVVTKIKVDSAQQTISTGPNEGQPYYRCRSGNRGFTCDQAFHDEWKKGNVAEVTLIESEYKVEDPEHPGEFLTRPSYQLSTWASYDQIEAIATREGKLELGAKQLEVSKMVLEQKALKELRLDEKAVAALQDAV